MARKPVALVAGVVGFLVYVIAVVDLAGRLAPMPWLLELLYFAVAGVAWALPAMWLLRWVVRSPR